VVFYYLGVAAKTTTSGEGLAFTRPGKESFFEVYAHDTRGHRQRRGGDDIVVKVLATTSTTISTAISSSRSEVVVVKDGGDGSYSVRYAVESGFDGDEVMVVVMVGDKHVARSPFRVRCERGCLGRFLRQVGQPGNGNGHLNYPYGLVVDGDQVFVADRNNHRIQVYSVVSCSTPSLLSALCICIL